MNEQLRIALDSRVAIEQAKGMVAERSGVNMDEALAALPNHARNQNFRLSDVARDIVNAP